MNFDKFHVVSSAEDGFASEVLPENHPKDQPWQVMACVSGIVSDFVFCQA